jgi:hypothetical protein
MIHVRDQPQRMGYVFGCPWRRWLHCISRCRICRDASTGKFHVAVDEQYVVNLGSVWAEHEDTPNTYQRVAPGTRGTIEYEYTNNVGTRVTVVRFPGGLIAELGPTAWVGEHHEC